ncbi:hypothetical protein JG687_00014617 [Phytophthora cactorum]|uniref:Uncharacterized protein n=1 Tax=Phytophthora cactorum TaxID=29920 RepID=A0A8T1TYW8_9STRA|nr:hypothetical protein JG687_00014617 [Phytophthora cactorum]
MASLSSGDYIPHIADNAPQDQTKHASSSTGRGQTTEEQKLAKKKSTRQRGPKLEAAGARSGRAAMVSSFYGDARGQYRPRRRHFRFLKTVLAYLLLIENTLKNLI